MHGRAPRLVDVRQGRPLSAAGRHRDVALESGHPSGAMAARHKTVME
jgi:hypothetical protein